MADRLVSVKTVSVFEKIFKVWHHRGGALYAPLVAAATLAFCAVLFSSPAQAAEPSQGVTVRVAAPADAQLSVLQQQASVWEEKTGHTVQFVKMSNSSSNNFVQYITWLSAQNAEIDVYKMDNPWIGQFARHLVDLAPHLGEHRDMIPNVLGVYTDETGRVLGLPYTVGTPVLYYRSDLLEKYDEPLPQSWAQLTAVADRIMRLERAAGNDNMWGFVWQGAAYEGLTVNALEWIHSNGGGTIVEPGGLISINNEKAAAALDLAASWVGGISPPGQLTYKEEDARAIFQLGNAVFMRNWPYAWGLLQTEDGSQVKDKFSITTLPAGDGGKSVAVMGGLGYSVSKYSKQQAAAIDLVLFLSSREMQRISAKTSLPPTYIDLYREPEILAAFPLLSSLEPVALSVVARPSVQTGIRYPEVSTEFWAASQHVLSGKKTGAESVADLERILKRVRGRHW